MPRFAANLTMMYSDLPFLERFEAAAKDGFNAVEYLFPYAYPAVELAARLKGNGLQQVLFNTPPGGMTSDDAQRCWESGDRGTACLPGREAEFQAGLSLALTYAQALDCPRIHAMVGLRAEGASAEAVFLLGKDLNSFKEIAQGLLDGLTQNNCSVFNGVVNIDVGVAG